MSAKWSVQPFKNTTIVDDDVLLVIDSEAAPAENKQVLFSNLKASAQTPWIGDIAAAEMNLNELGSVNFTNTLGTNPQLSALQSGSESTIVFGSNAQITSGDLRILSGDALLTSGDLLLSDGFIDFTEIVTPSDPATDVGRLYVKDDGGGITTLYFRDSVGTETNLLAGGGGGGIANAPKLFFGINQMSFAFDDTDIYRTLDFDNNTTTESDIQFEVPVDTSFSNFVLTVPTNDLNDDFTMTLRVNGANSAAVITVSSSSTGTFTSSESISLSAGDLVNWEMATSATSGELQQARISFSMPSGAGGDDPAAFFGVSQLFFTNGESNIYKTLDFNNDSDAESDVQFEVPANTGFSNFVLKVPQNDLDEDLTLILRVNGINTSTITVPSSTTGSFTSTSSTILTKGDLINWEINDNGAGSGEIQEAKLSFSMPFDSKGDSTPVFFGVGQLSFNNGDTTIYQTIDFTDNTDTESDAQFEVPVDTSFSNFVLVVPTNDLDEDLTLTLRVNGANTDAVITVPSGDTGTFTSPVSVPLSESDLINWEVNDNGAGSGQIDQALISFSMPTNTGGAITIAPPP